MFFARAVRSTSGPPSACALLLDVKAGSERVGVMASQSLKRAKTGEWKDDVKDECESVDETVAARESQIAGEEKGLDSAADTLLDDSVAGTMVACESQTAGEEKGFDSDEGNCEDENGEEEEDKESDQVVARIRGRSSWRVGGTIGLCSGRHMVPKT